MKPWDLWIFKPKSCARCGETFTPNSGRQEGCTVCMPANNARRLREWRRQNKKMMITKTTFETKPRPIDVLDVALVGAIDQGELKPFARIVELFPTMARTTLKDRVVSLQRMGYVKLHPEGHALLIEKIREAVVRD